jgi:hypothetical protein
MPRKLRVAARFASPLIVAICVSARLSGAGISIAIPGLLGLLIFLALAWIAVDLAMWSVAAASWRARVPLWAATVACSAIALAFGFTALLTPGVPDIVLGEVPSGLGRVTACLVSVPLVSDFVVVERRISVMPGVYVYKIIETFDPAWDPRFQYTKGIILISYSDDAHKWHQVEVRL